jgi:hypothetical protein
VRLALLEVKLQLEAIWVCSLLIKSAKCRVGLLVEGVTRAGVSFSPDNDVARVAGSSRLLKPFVNCRIGGGRSQSFGRAMVLIQRERTARPKSRKICRDHRHLIARFLTPVIATKRS